MGSSLAPSLFTLSVTYFCFTEEIQNLTASTQESMKNVLLCELCLFYFILKKCLFGALVVCFDKFMQICARFPISCIISHGLQ